MQVQPLDDPIELAAIARCLQREPPAAIAFAHATRKPEGQAYGYTVKDHVPDKRQRLAGREIDRMNEVFGHARRVLRLRCDRCNAILADWQHLIDGKPLSAPDWARRREVWGDEGVEPWRGWLLNETAGEAFRDFWVGQVILACRGCQRPSLELSLQRIRVDLDAAAKAETITVSA